MAESPLELASAPRWKGRAGRMEVWYATLTHPPSGTGLWVHYETVAPTSERGGAPYGHGWVALFPRDGEPASWRFGPAPIAAAPAGGSPAGKWFDAAGAIAAPGELSGEAGDASWDLTWDDGGAPLWTFPELAWRRELLPGAQVVLAPAARFDGSLTTGGTRHSFEGSTGGVAHIYGHGSAEKWVWLHADLGGGEVCELVSAVSRKPGLNRLRPLAFLRFRLGGRDWPRTLGPSLRVRTRIGLPRWLAEGRAGQQRVRIAVEQPEDRCVALTYVDPDGETAVCTNSERADAEISIERRAGNTWVTERHWRLDGTAHAEVGLRGEDAPRPNERSG